MSSLFFILTVNLLLVTHRYK